MSWLFIVSGFIHTSAMLSQESPSELLDQLSDNFEVLMLESAVTHLIYLVNEFTFHSKPNIATSNSNNHCSPSNQVQKCNFLDLTRIYRSTTCQVLTLFHPDSHLNHDCRATYHYFSDSTLSLCLGLHHSQD